MQMSAEVGQGFGAKQHALGSEQIVRGDEKAEVVVAAASETVGAFIKHVDHDAQNSARQIKMLEQQVEMARVQAAEEIARMTRRHNIEAEDSQRQLKEATLQLDDLQARLHESQQQRQKDKKDASEEILLMQQETLSLNAKMTQVHKSSWRTY